MLVHRKSEISSQIGDIQSRADAVVQMGKKITTGIEELCARAKAQCEAIVENKLTVLLGDEQELRRQAKEIEYLDTFLQYQQQGDSMECVYTWHVHQMYQEKLADFQFFRKNIDVLVDAKIEGSIKVIEDVNKVIDGRNTMDNSSKQSQHSSPKRPLLPPRQSDSTLLQAPFAPSAEKSSWNSQFETFAGTLGMVIVVNRRQIFPGTRNSNGKLSVESRTFLMMHWIFQAIGTLDLIFSISIHRQNKYESYPSFCFFQIPSQ